MAHGPEGKHCNTHEGTVNQDKYSEATTAYSEMLVQAECSIQ